MGRNPVCFQELTPSLVAKSEFGISYLYRGRYSCRGGGLESVGQVPNYFASKIGEVKAIRIPDFCSADPFLMQNEIGGD